MKGSFKARSPLARVFCADCAHGLRRRPAPESHMLDFHKETPHKGGSIGTGLAGWRRVRARGNFNISTKLSLSLSGSISLRKHHTKTHREMFSPLRQPRQSGVKIHAQSGVKIPVPVRCKIFGAARLAPAEPRERPPRPSRSRAATARAGCAAPRTRQRHRPATRELGASFQVCLSPKDLYIRRQKTCISEIGTTLEASFLAKGRC